MKKFCKKILKCSVLLSFLAVSFLMTACLFDFDEDTEVILLPDNDLKFQLYPNDKANNDSIDANLAHGITLIVHPEASYELSFDKDDSKDAPKLQLFRLYLSDDGLNYYASKVRELSATERDGRYIYKFDCHENDMSLWAATLEQDRDYFVGSTKNVFLKGSGHYSDHLSLNLIAVGNVAENLKGFTLEELAEQMLKRFRKIYSSITIDTLYISYAQDHPQYGKYYPANRPWLAGKSSKDMMVSDLGGWPGREYALDLILVHYIDQNNILGFSNLFSGNLGGGEGSTVVLGANVKSYGGSEPVAMNDIVETALHETGHFFGLRHTTASSADLETYEDYSNYEDGFEDTPYCPELLRSGLLKRGESIPVDYNARPYRFRRKVTAANMDYNFSAEHCGDASNFMFPLVTSIPYSSFSEEQLEIIRKSLTIFPH